MEKLRTPLILDIKGNSWDDGPGIRSVVFFKGCPLSCTWCHNPEGKRPEVEIGFDAGDCVGCDNCLSLCPEQALSRDNRFFVDRDSCTLCFRCEDGCPSGALRRIGSPMSVAEIVDTVVKDAPFYATSGGGVTLSGGEPTLFADFAALLLETLKGHGIHTLLETCGLFDLGRFDDTLYPWLDAIYFDIKLMDAEAHARYCGAPNQIILNNFRELVQRGQSGGVPVVPRTPLIPGITDARDNMQAIAAFLAQCGVRQAQLLPYHPLWREKNPLLGLEDPSDESADLKGWPDRGKLETCRSIFGRAGVCV